MLGLLLAAGLVLLVDYFDDTLRTVRKVEEVLQAPVIGQITETGEKRKWYERVGRVNHRDIHPGNAFGDLRINLSRLMVDRSEKRILVTSTTRGEGKTTVAANLAKAFLQSGKKIVLVDADLYHPQLHKRLGLQNVTGLTNILLGGVEWQNAAITDGNLTVITAGTTSSSPSGFLESHDMGALLDKLQAEADVVIVDGPPLFVVDAQVLASKVGGVLLVTRQGETRINAARSVARKLQLLGIHLYGMVLNGVPSGEVSYYDGYYERVGDQEPQAQIEEHGDRGRT
jgi:capsular exopolysaccharide synthesis family protein